MVDGDSCLQLYNYGFSSSGVYRLRQRDGRPPYKAYCDMNGGWTLIMKIDGRKSTFLYNSYLWTSDKDTYNVDAVDLNDDREVKLASFWALPFTEMLLGMKHNSRIRWITVSKIANSLYSLLADGQYRSFSKDLGKKEWMAMIPGSSLQINCNREGFNVLSSHTIYGVRIGMITNNERDCASADSRIGFGGRGDVCGPPGAANNSCGNVSPLSDCAHSSHGPVNIPVFGYILAR
ncbi:uncharacterized skeletal organic matrix protein 5-like [Corticium candelabrum]|uniref:uncharacterized skeletal organic matrix protein 5-like n=1 Tax=Corticium candelabrum TaxID=121492 RepID=UPI002E25280E|nr:uncharacterized skeletal organic matrix protein 5-like [Corticium candelabrum]